MSDTAKEKPITLSERERRHLEALAAGRPFWRSILDKAVDWERDDKIALFRKVLDMLHLDMERYPSIVAGAAVRNRADKDGNVTCWVRDCKERATVAIEGVAVCRDHQAAQIEASKLYRSTTRLKADMARTSIGDDDDAE